LIFNPNKIVKTCTLTLVERRNKFDPKPTVNKASPKMHFISEV